MCEHVAANYSRAGKLVLDLAFWRHEFYAEASTWFIPRNFNALPPVVVSGFPNITPIFILIWLMNMTIHFDLLILDVSFLSACDISLA